MIAPRSPTGMLARVQLFAIARQRAGRPVVEVDLPDGATVADLKVALRSHVHALAAILHAARFAVDSEYVDDDAPIPPGAEIALIPPVSGGAREG